MASLHSVKQLHAIEDELKRHELHRTWSLEAKLENNQDR
jgi:hypothetical protein